MSGTYHDYLVFKSETFWSINDAMNEKKNILQYDSSFQLWVVKSPNNEDAVSRHLARKYVKDSAGRLKKDPETFKKLSWNSSYRVCLTAISYRVCLTAFVREWPEFLQYKPKKIGINSSLFRLTIFFLVELWQ